MTRKNKKKKGKGLTDRQRLFCEEYVLTNNQTEAALAAGFGQGKKKSASDYAGKLLKEEPVKAYVEELREKLRENDAPRIADKIEVLEFLTATMRGEVEEPVLRQINGEQVVEWVPASAGERLKSANLLGKHYGLFTDNVNAKIEGSVVFLNEDEIKD